MVLDNENQRKVILAAINSTQWPGQVIEEVILVKRAVMAAKIEENVVSEQK